MNLRIVLASALVATAGLPAAATGGQSEQELAELRGMLDALLSTMVERGVINRDQAVQMLSQGAAGKAVPLGAGASASVDELKREREALARDLALLKLERESITEQLEQASVDQELLAERQRLAIQAEVQRQVDEALAAQRVKDNSDVRVRYVPGHVLAEIREDVKRELKEEVKNDIVEGVYENQGEEGLPIPEVPEWVGRTKIGGDVRIRYQHDGIAPDSGKWYDYEKVNERGVFSATDAGADHLARTNMDRDRLRGRLRLDVETRVGYDFKAGARLATGNDGDPTSTNQTLSTSLNRYEVSLDRAYLSYGWTDETGQWKVKGIGGRFSNPFYSTDLVWDSDIGFEGLAGSASYKNERPQRIMGVGVRGYTVRSTLGAFPLEEYSFTNRDKWLIGAQVDAEATLLDTKKLHFGLAYYTYQNVTGVADSRGVGQTARDAYVDASAPMSMQKGNTLYDLYSSANGAQNFDVFGLASDYNLVNFSAGIEIPDMAPYYVWLSADYVKNIGYDAGDVAARVGGADTTNPVDGDHDTGFMLRAETGSPWMLDQGEWRLFAAYKYIEPDAVLDAYNDSDFLLGGTNAKGFMFGGSYVVQRDVTVGFRYFNAESIVNPLDPKTPGNPSLAALKTTSMQLEINAKF